MKTVILFIALALLFSSCRATRQTVRNEVVATENIQLDISAKTVETVQETSQQTEISEHNVEMDIDETVINIQFSAPDSLGNQHIVSATQTIRALRSIERNTATVETEQTRQSEVVERLNDNTIIEAHYHSVSENKRERVPAWQYVFGVFAIAIFVLIIIRRAIK